MLDERLRVERTLTEGDLQKIARDMYEERLVEVCTEQRSTPGDAEYSSATNCGFFDYFDRLVQNGGHMSLMSAEKDHLRAEG